MTQPVDIHRIKLPVDRFGKQEICRKSFVLERRTSRGMDASQYKDYVLVLLFIILPQKQWYHL
jgi:hypothetical protein